MKPSSSCVERVAATGRVPAQRAVLAADAGIASGDARVDGTSQAVL